MTRYSANDDIGRLRAQNPIDEILAERGHYPVRVLNGGTHLLYRSPLRVDHNPSFDVNLALGPGGVFYDFGTGKGGDSITLIQELDGCSTAEAIRRLKERRS